MFKGKFLTAYLQREVPEDVIVIGGDPLEVGQLVIYTPSTGNIPAYIEAATSSNSGAVGAAEALAQATHIMAQSDMTLGYGHVPVEMRDYRPNQEIAPSVVNKSSGLPLDTSNFRGIYATAQALTAGATGATNGAKALVGTGEGDYALYSSNGSTWSNANQPYVVTTKKVAMYVIHEDHEIHHDVIAYDDEA